MPRAKKTPERAPKQVVGNGTEKLKLAVADLAKLIPSIAADEILNAYQLGNNPTVAAAAVSVRDDIFAVRSLIKRLRLRSERDGGFLGKSCSRAVAALADTETWLSYSQQVFEPGRTDKRATNSPILRAVIASEKSKTGGLVWTDSAVAALLLSRGHAKWPSRANTVADVLKDTRELVKKARTRFRRLIARESQIAGSGTEPPPR